MSRRFIRPFFDFHDPLFTPNLFLRPQGSNIRYLRPVQKQIQASVKTNDPYQIFENFFNQNGIKQLEQRKFFQKHYPQKVQQELDPYKVLKIDRNCTQEKIKQAYRKLALKYHPKNNSSPEAQKQFEKVARAYQEAIKQKNDSKYYDFGFKSFFDDFDKKIQELVNTVKIEPEPAKQKEKIKSKTPTQENDYGELYSQSSHVQNINGKQTKFIVQKKYKKDRKFLSVKREQTLKDDGKTQILQTIDDGKQIKKKHYILDKVFKKTDQLM